jgi:methionyl aminopeptidase
VSSTGIVLKSEDEIAAMRRAGAVVAEVLETLAQEARPGVTTRRLDSIAYDVIRAHGATPSFLGHRGYPNTICASINDVVVHGIPDGTRLREGDIVGVDVGAKLDGFHGDAARTFAIGEVSEEKRRLLARTEEALERGIAAARAGNRLRDIARAIQEHVEAAGLSVVRALVGHGIGRELWEPPQVPNYVDGAPGLRLQAGMTLAIEPMINAGGCDVVSGEDGWTIRTADGSPSAHFEHTVVVREGGAEILTRPA